MKPGREGGVLVVRLVVAGKAELRALAPVEGLDQGLASPPDSMCLVPSPWQVVAGVARGPASCPRAGSAHADWSAKALTWSRGSRRRPGASRRPGFAAAVGCGAGTGAGVGERRRGPARQRSPAESIARAAAPSLPRLITPSLPGTGRSGRPPTVLPGVDLVDGAIRVGAVAGGARLAEGRRIDVRVRGRVLGVVASEAGRRRRPLRREPVAQRHRRQRPRRIRLRDVLGAARRGTSRSRAGRRGRRTSLKLLTLGVLPKP